MTDQASPFVPGSFRCAKCGFVLIQANLNAQDGTVIARDAPGDRCPNDGAPMWRVTWRERAEEAEERLGRLLSDPRVQAIECDILGFDRPDHLKDCLRPISA